MTAAEIAGFRRRHDLTQAELGALFEPPLPRQQVNRLERGKRPLSPGMAARLREVVRRLEVGLSKREDR